MSNTARSISESFKDWDAISTIAEVVSAVSVVVSLVYLAIQLRSNTRALRASAAWDSEFIYGNVNYELGLNPDTALLAAERHGALSLSAKPN